MAKSLLRLLLLGTLSAGASFLPRLLGGLPAAGSAGLPRAGGSAPPGFESLAALGGAVADLKKVRDPAPAGLEELSPEERELAREAAPRLEFKSNALTRSLGLAGGGARAGGSAPDLGRVLEGVRNARGPDFQSFSDYRRDLLAFYSGHRAGVTWALWLSPAVAASLSFLLLLLRRYTLSMLLAGLLFALANFLLWALSVSVALSAVLTKRSLLEALPGELWLAPVIFLAVSSGLLRLADENYPFWNRTVAALAAPIVASCLASGWVRGGGLLKSALSAASRRLE